MGTNGKFFLINAQGLLRRMGAATEIPGTSWEQYHQVFEAIVRSNAWDNDTAALQLFSHLEGDALNVAHLVPLARRLSRAGLVDALTAHYGSPGRLADYRRQFKRTIRTSGEDPANFATALGVWGYGTDSLTAADSGQIYSWPQQL